MKINNLTKQILTHAGIIIVFLVISFMYLSPVLDGKVINQSDVKQYEGMVREQWDYHNHTGEYANWNESAFSGMPTYQIGAIKPTPNIFNPIKNLITLSCFGDAPHGRGRDIGILFVYLIGFYIALLALGLNPWLSLFGSIAFALGSYNIIILAVGHITKAWAISMMAPIIASMIMIFKKKYVWGSILFSLSLGVQIQFNHIQITYYTLIIAAVLGITYFIYAIKNKEVKHFFIGTGTMLLCCVMVLLCTSRYFVLNSEYLKYTMRGGSDITVTPNDLYNDNQSVDTEKNKGLDIEYAYSWSYGKAETMTMLIPGFNGGGSNEKVSKDSDFYKAFRQQGAPLYWGEQPFTMGPVYIGAIIIFLFVLGLFVVKGPERWWILIATIIGILMSWGKNFLGFNEFLFNYLPMYNKFRTPSMSLVIPSVTMVIMACLCLKSILNKEIEKKQLNLYLYISTGIFAVICLFFIMFGKSIFSFSGAADVQMGAAYGENWKYIQDILVNERISLFISDTWRSLILIIISAAVIFVYTNVMKKSRYDVIAIFAILIIFDLWSVDRRYLDTDKDTFVAAKKMKVQQSDEDKQITQYAEMFGDKNYRVYNVAGNPFNESGTSAYNHSIGGYSGAKLGRYQDIIDFYLSRGNMNVINMLNTRYFIVSDRQGARAVQRNPEAYGEAWFVKDVKFVDSANDEILALNDTDLKNVAIVNKNEFKNEVGEAIQNTDSLASVETEFQAIYNPDYLVYNTHSATDGIVVFSEIYYAPDWFAYIDGMPAEYFRTNYILRGLRVPAGDHKIEFKNEAPTLKKWDTIALISTIVYLLSIGALLFFYFRRRKQETL